MQIANFDGLVEVLQKENVPFRADRDTGLRFSRKARGPSSASSLRYTASKARQDARSAAVRPISVAMRTISLALRTVSGAFTRMRAANSLAPCSA